MLNKLAARFLRQVALTSIDLAERLDPLELLVEDISVLPFVWIDVPDLIAEIAARN